MDRATARVPRFNSRAISRYYDRHTAAFIRYGQGGRLGAIHRAVWGHGVTTREQAFRHVEDQIADMVRALIDIPEPSSAAEKGDPPDVGLRAHVVDLGCGVGASLCYLAERLPIFGTGITLSRVQAKLGMRRAINRGLSDRVACIEGDYSDLPPDVEQADLIYAIESFIHSPAPDRFFAECRRLMKPKGLLVICDDFRRLATGNVATKTVDRFCRGWHVNALLRQDEVRALAQAAGFKLESTVDLTPALELRRVRDRVANGLCAVCEWFSINPSRFDHLLGGAALQECLARGWIGYDLIVFRRIE